MHVTDTDVPRIPGSEAADAEAFTIRWDDDGDVLRATVSGELDLQTEPQLIAEVRRRLAGCDASRVVLDVADVSFLDSSGLRALLRSRDEATRAGKTMRLAVRTGPVTRLLELSGVDTWFSYA